MCRKPGRKPLLFLLTLVAFAYLLVKHVSSQAPVKPPEVAARGANRAVSAPEPTKPAHEPLITELVLPPLPPMATIKSAESLPLAENFTIPDSQKPQDGPNELVVSEPALPPVLPPIAVISSPPVAEMPPAALTSHGKAAVPPAPSPAAVAPSKRSLNIWSIHVEQADGKNVVRATIGKNSGIKIICDKVNLQTANDFFQAQGKVVVAGENVQCRCENLTIDLNEDRLLLEGNAEIGILKHKTDFVKEREAPAHEDKNELTVQDEPKGARGPAQKKEAGRPTPSQSFLVELKGERFSLRWPDMHIKMDDPQPPVDGALAPPEASSPDAPPGLR
jgi:hypothetical protein